MDNLRLFLRYVGISVRSQMQYRASFLMLAAGHLLVTGSEWLAVWALFTRFGSLRGWSLPEVALLYGVINCGFALAEGVGRGWDTFSTLLKSGDFDRLLLRPRSTALQVAAREVQVMRIGRLLQGAAALGWGVWSLPATWDPPRLVLLASAVAGAACLFYGLLVLQATLAFWTVETLELMNTVTYGGIETAQYPLSIYRGGFRAFFTWVVPLSCANYLPVREVVGRLPESGVPAWLPWFAPLVGVAFMLICLRVWRLGERRYTSTGS